MRAWRLMLFLAAWSVVLATGPVWGQVELFDASIRHTSSIFVPLASYDVPRVRPLTTQTWTDHARPVSRVVADGVSLVVVRIRLPALRSDMVHVTVASDVADADPGSIWAIQDQRVLDTTTLGGAIDTSVGERALDVQPLIIGPGRLPQRVAFALYRAPRNFDTANGSTSDMSSRTVKITAQSVAFDETTTVTVVRPLVVFIHGTGATNDAWLNFPLWRNSANEVNGFTPGSLPFHATRISFNWIWNASGGVHDNAATILPQLVTALRDWREATGTAATQADVITHSFGGFIARQVVQTQPDPSPLSARPLHNFRSVENWGHGSIHKLITLAAPHRGAATANATADVNKNGHQEGALHDIACELRAFIEKGALADQMVLSPALEALNETRVPGHAIAGSGRAALDRSGLIQLGLTALASADKSTEQGDTEDGFYTKAAKTPAHAGCFLDLVSNYIFNRDANSPPVTGMDTGIKDTCDVEEPNYDGAVSTYSSLGLMPASATTTADDLSTNELSLLKLLNHSALHDPAAAGSSASEGTAIVARVSGHVASLLQEPTLSEKFSYFPAPRDARLSAIEQELSTISPTWLTLGNPCSKSVFEPCPAYANLQVVPSSLRLDDATPTPLSVYGLLGTDWVLASCLVTLESHDDAVATIATNDTTSAQTVVAVGIGVTKISVSVKDRGTLTVPLTVTGSSEPAPGAGPAGEERDQDGIRFRSQLIRIRLRAIHANPRRAKAARRAGRTARRSSRSPTAARAE